MRIVSVFHALLVKAKRQNFKKKPKTLPDDE